MKFLRYIPLLFLAAACQQEISPEQADKFLKVYGNAYMDVAKDIAVLDDGRFAFCGIDSIPGEGSRAVLVLTDKFGNVADGFPKYYSDGGNNSGANAMLIEDGGQGGFLIVGYVDVPHADSTQRDLFLVRTSNTGRELWRRSFGTVGDESVLHASELISESGYLLAGYQYKDGKRDIMVMGVSDQGDSLKLGLPFKPPADQAAVNYIQNTGDAYVCVCTYDIIGRDGTDILILVLDEDLSLNIKVLGGDFDEEGKAMVATGPNEFLVLGNRVNAAGKTEMELHMIEIDGYQVTGSNLIATIGDASGNLTGNRISMLSDGRFGIVGTREAGGNKDMFVQFLGSDYSVGERILYGGSGVEKGADVDVPIDGGMIILGTSGEHPSSMISLIRTAEDGAL